MTISFRHTERESVGRLVLANRILYDQGVVDAMGHVSVRCASDPEHFLLSRSRPPALVTEGDIQCYDLDAVPVPGCEQAHYLERFIHSEIYKARPDVMAVVHSHSPSVLPLAATGTRLRPIFHMAGFLGQGAGHFEIRDVAGESDMLVRSPSLGSALARSLGACSCVLMRGHGSTVVGPSLETAVYRAIYVEVNARVQAQALALGEVAYLSEAEGRLSDETNQGQILRSWSLWCERVGVVDPSLSALR